MAVLGRGSGSPTSESDPNGNAWARKWKLEFQNRAQGRSATDVEGYSTRMPDIARAMTSCWISLVPSKIVWILAQGFLHVDE